MASVPFAFLIGLLRSRLSRAAAVSELVARLGGPAIAKACATRSPRRSADPSLSLAYWLPEPGRYVDAEGRAVELPARDRQPACTPVEHDGRRGGDHLPRRRRSTTEPELVEPPAPRPALALENERAGRRAARARRGAARLARADRRGGRRGAPAARARPPRRRPAAARRAGARPAAGAARSSTATPARRGAARRDRRASSARRPPSCASWPAASTRRCSSDRGLRAGARGARRRARRCRSSSAERAGRAPAGRRSRRPPTSSSPRR